MAKILLFDIETTNFNADFGHLLCISYKFLGEKKVHTVKLEGGDPKSLKHREKKLLKAFMDVYETADIVVSYFGTGFDVPYMQAKSMHYGLGALPNIAHVDLYWTVKSNFKISRKSLQNVGYFLGLSAEKTPVEGDLWLLAMLGDRGSLNYIVRHCVADVLILEELYLKIRSLVRMHPRVNGFGPCRTCGSKKLQSRGVAVTKLVRQRRRVYCSDCGSWDYRPL